MAGSAFVSSLRCHLWFKAHFEIPNVCVDRFGVKGSNITASERWGTSPNTTYSAISQLFYEETI